MPTRDEPPGGTDLRSVTADHLEWQSGHCRSLGSALYARLLATAAEDCRAGGPTWQVLEPVATWTLDDALPLRFMAAVHRLVLAGEAPALAAYYSTVGGSPHRDGVWEAFRDVLVSHAEDVRALARRPCQTNEVARSAALAVGFLTLAHDTRLPLRLREVGASAGLNLRWDHFRYIDEEGSGVWGPASSPVVLRGHWDVPAQLLAVSVDVVERRGCDARPVDVTTKAGRLDLMASLWGDQPERLQRLRGALDVAARVPADVAAAPVRDWVPANVAPAEGAATVLYHSVVWQYLGDEDRRAQTAALTEAGAAATARSPLAWLRMEPEVAARGMHVRLTTWPGGDERLLATAGAHGFPVRRRHTLAS